MLDIRFIRKERAKVEEKLRTKDSAINLDKLLALDEEIRAHKTKVEALKASRNDFSQEIGKRKRENIDATELLKQVAELGNEIHTIDAALAPLEREFEHELASLPNLPMDDVKISSDVADNEEIKRWGERPSFNFPFKNHVELNEKLGLFDFKRAAKIAGSGWPAYRGWGARLEWALINFMVETQLKNGFELWMPPLLVRQSTLYGSGQLPKFTGQQFQIHDDDYNLFLIPTAEVPLNGMHSEEILEEEQLPLYYTAYTPCFRREAGAAGAQERGLIRMHQFNKVEMFCFAKPEESDGVFNTMVGYAEGILEALELHYRSVLLVTGDMSFAAARTVDVEVWLPGQNRYYEVSSISNCTDYQARRSQIRFKRAKEGKVELVHTLNGSGLATSRLMVALLENNQRADGSIAIPKVLQPYLGGKELLEPCQ